MTTQYEETETPRYVIEMSDGAALRPCDRTKKSRPRAALS